MAKVKKDHAQEVNAFKNPIDPLEAIMQPMAQMQPQPEIEHFKEIVKQAYSKKDIELKSDYNAKQVLVLTQMKLYAKMYKSKVMSQVVKDFSELRVSLKRQGRKEFVQVARSMGTQIQMGEPEPKSRFM